MGDDGRARPDPQRCYCEALPELTAHLPRVTERLVATMPHARNAHLRMNMLAPRIDEHAQKKTRYAYQGPSDSGDYTTPHTFGKASRGVSGSTSKLST